MKFEKGSPPEQLQAGRAEAATRERQSRREENEDLGVFSFWKLCPREKAFTCLLFSNNFLVTENINRNKHIR